ncbi:beta-N-acetylhexosaminidase [Paenibacillus sp. GCM10028914]|uniref:beta-N-acetylhexosaminidase n=1 Tax=Paenibacillus sp. GCM10028914 TaxID=3273416 RepID=UPI0036D388B0
MKGYTYILLFMGLLIVLITGCEDGYDTGAKDTLVPTQTDTSNDPKELHEDSEEVVIESSTSNETDLVNDPELKLLEELTLEEKVGQLVIVGMEGTSVDHSSRKLIDTYHVGGFIFFKDNIEDTNQAVKLFNGLKKANSDNPVPLWMSIDEEGGRVTRMPESFPRLPSSGLVGKQNDPAIATEIGKHIGLRLTGFGLNMAFAPVLDVNSNPDNPVIGDRAFGNSADRVGKLGIAAMKGIQETGVVSVVKHFPGHGDTSVDSHFGLPVVDYDLNRLRTLELVPFQKAIDQGADVVMVGHLLMSKIDSDTPASYSKPVITDLLREELGFKGVVITDDMIMGAVNNGKITVGEAAVRSILAGTNIVLVGHEYDKEEAVIRSLLKAVNNNRIPEEILDERVLTILRLKHKYNINDNPVKGPDVTQLNEDAQQLMSRLKP